jgi:hypothetical protein
MPALGIAPEWIVTPSCFACELGRRYSQLNEICGYPVPRIELRSGLHGSH